MDCGFHLYKSQSKQHECEVVSKTRNGAAETGRGHSLEHAVAANAEPLSIAAGAKRLENHGRGVDDDSAVGGICGDVGVARGSEEDAASLVGQGDAARAEVTRKVPDSMEIS